MWLNWLLALGWLWRVGAALRNLPRVPNLLDEKYAARARNAADNGAALVLSVIVPARNEAKAIEVTLQSLLAVEGLPLEIVAVDDRSTDDTGAIMDRVAEDAAANHVVGRPVLRVHHVQDLPDGWMGKTHAMAMAARMTTAPLLLFTDGDVVFAKDSLARAVCFMQTERADHLVLVPTLILRSAGERMVISFLQAFSAWVARPWRVPDPSARHDFIGVGAFNLLRREVYDAVGGFESLRMEVLEDLRLGFKVKRAGYAQRVAFGKDLIRIRWAEGALGIIRNLTKNAFSIFRFRVGLLLIACLGMSVFTTVPFVGLFFGWPARLASLVSCGMILLIYRFYKQYSGTPVLYGFTFPLAGLLLVYATLRSLALTLVRGGVDWRGTLYPLRELRKHCGPLW